MYVCMKTLPYQTILVVKRGVAGFCITKYCFDTTEYRLAYIIDNTLRNCYYVAEIHYYMPWKRLNVFFRMFQLKEIAQCFQALRPLFVNFMTCCIFRVFKINSNTSPRYTQKISHNIKLQVIHLFPSLCLVFYSWPPPKNLCHMNL